MKSLLGYLIILLVVLIPATMLAKSTAASISAKMDSAIAERHQLIIDATDGKSVEL